MGLYPKISTIVFDNREKPFVTDRLASLIKHLPPSIKAVQFVANLSPAGVLEAAELCASNTCLTSFVSRLNPLRADVSAFFSAINQSRIHSLVRPSLL